LRMARECLAGPKQEGAMDGDIQATEKLLVELREAYRRLPQHIQGTSRAYYARTPGRHNPSNKRAS
jgi:hypothetical protein